MRSAERPAFLPPVEQAALLLASLLVLADLVPAWLSSGALAARLSDFRVLYVAAVVGREYGWDHIYDLAATHAVTARLIGGLAFDPLQIFDYPPPMAWLVAPLSWLPLTAAYFVWVAVGVTALAAASWLALGPRTATWVTAFVASLAFMPVFRGSFLGQPLLLMVLAIIVAWRLLVSGRQVWAGLALSVLCLKPHLALVLIPALAASGRFRALAAWAGAVSLLVLASIATLGSRGLAGVVDAIKVEDDAAVAHGLRIAAVGGRYSWVVICVVVATALVLAFVLRRQPAWTLILGISASLVASPFLHLQDATMLVPAAWLALRTVPGAAARWALVPLLVAFDAGVIGAWGRDISTWSGVVALSLLATFVVFAATACSCALRPVVDAPPPPRPATPAGEQLAAARRS